MCGGVAACRGQKTVWDPPRTGVIDGCELPDVGAVAWTQVLYKSGMHSLIVELSL